MRARSPVIASADAKSNLPQLEMGQELLPLGGIELAIFFAGSLGSAARDECPVVSDHVLGVDRGVPHRGVEKGVAADLRRDVRRKPRSEGVGDEDPPEVMGPPFQRFTGGGDLRGL